MPKLIFRAALAGCATAGLAVAQTPLPPPVILHPPVPQSPARATTPAKHVLKTFDVADLVCPPADSPLARPGTDPAMAAAAKAFTDVRAEELLAVVRKVASGSWAESGGGAKAAVTTDGKTLVVNNTAGACDAVGECVESFRKHRTARVRVEMVLVRVPCENGEVVKLMGDKAAAELSADDWNATMQRLKACGSLDVLTRPTLMLTNKQTGFFQVGQVVPTVNGKRVEPVGTCSRVTPDVSADGKTVGLAVDIQHSDCHHGKVDCQQVQTHVRVPDGGTMAVRVGTREVERKVEMKVPVVGEIPYLGRLFRNVGISSEKADVVAVLTVTRVADEPAVVPAMAPAASPLPPAAQPLDRVGVGFSALTTPPTAATRVAPYGLSFVRYVSPEGAQLAGGVIGTTAGGPPACDDTAGLMTAYKAACAAGRTDDATRLALQLLAKDPTCFGK